MKRVIVESPYANSVRSEQVKNIAYARTAMKDCIIRGEAPFASHLLYTQPFVLDDEIPTERLIGIEAGYAWGDAAALHAFYTDRGWSNGMLLALNRCTKRRYDVEFRSIGGTPLPPPDPTLDLEPIE